ncbi:MAG: PH domain-containing protein [Kocuria sp.]|nr:PH domain-containing protein [Kocuria sp.]
MSDQVLNSGWTFTSQVETPQDLAELLVPGEVPVASFKTVRDTATFTNKRLIVRDAQGLMGKKVETYSIPYSSINMWSTENAGGFDLNAEIELWTRAGLIKINVGRNIDVRKLDRLIAQSVLGV